MFSDLSNHRWNVSTIGIDGTVVLGASFIFLAYVLTPAIESAYQNVRASRAWRAIEEGQEVEVTDYPMATEVFGGRGKWDSARVVTVLLAVFSLASWGLELSMDLAYYEGSADLLNRPPPVTLGKRNGSPVWQVKTQEELGYKQPWRDLPNVFQGHANSRYYLNNGNFEHRYIDGGIVAALWFNNTDDKRFELHYQDRIMATMNDLRCAKDETDKRMDVYIGNSKWGTVVQCESGPTVTLKSASEATGTRTENAPPTIILTSSDELFLIVEENSSHPSFLYSVWTYRSKHDDEVELHHVFHIATSMRLAEAVVTGIVHGERTGGGCFGLLRRFSEGEGFYDIGIMRSSPFGEHPTGDRVKVQDLERIYYGLRVSSRAIVCLVWLAVLSAIGLTWSFCLTSNIGMDVYDRDVLFRAISLRGVDTRGAPHSAIRMFVRKEKDTGDIVVAIIDTVGSRSGCARMLRREGEVAGNAHPVRRAATATEYNGSQGGAVLPVQSQTASSHGLRMGMGRDLPGREGILHHPTSDEPSPPPTPSTMRSTRSPPVGSASREIVIERGCRGSVASCNCCVERAGLIGAFITVFGNHSGGPAMSRAVLGFDTDNPAKVGRDAGKSPCHSPSSTATCEISTELSPFPPP